MIIARFSGDADGNCHFSDVEIPLPFERLAATGDPLSTSAAFASPNVQFIGLPAGFDAGLHPVPATQLVVVLSGEVEIGTPSGELRTFGPGAMVLADDVGTEGHTTRTIGGGVELLYIPIVQPEDLISRAT